MALLTVDFHTKALARRTRMDVFIPSLNLGGCLRNQDVNYYQNNHETYPLIIFLHGFGDNEKAWQINTQILKLCEDKKNRRLLYQRGKQVVSQHGAHRKLRVPD